MKFSMTVH